VARGESRRWLGRLQLGLQRVDLGACPIAEVLAVLGSQLRAGLTLGCPLSFVGGRDLRLDVINAPAKYPASKSSHGGVDDFVALLGHDS